MTGPQAMACLTTGAAAGVLLLGLGTLRAALRARRQESRPALVAPVNRDVLHPRSPMLLRPVPPVVPPPGAPQHYQQVAGIWGLDILEIPHTVRQYPYVDWQAKIQERRN